MARPHRRPMAKMPDCYELKSDWVVLKGDRKALKGNGEALKKTWHFDFEDEVE